MRKWREKMSEKAERDNIGRKWSEKIVSDYRERKQTEKVECESETKQNEIVKRKQRKWNKKAEGESGKIIEKKYSEKVGWKSSE